MGPLYQVLDKRTVDLTPVYGAGSPLLRGRRSGNLKPDSRASGDLALTPAMIYERPALIEARLVLGMSVFEN